MTVILIETADGLEETEEEAVDHHTVGQEIGLILTVKEISIHGVVVIDPVVGSIG